MPLTVNEMANYAEFTVPKKLEGTYRLQRIGMIAAHIIVPILFMLALIATGLGAIALIVFIPVYYCFLLPRLVWPMTYRYVQLEYEYVIISGDLTLNRIYGEKFRKPWIEKVSISNMTAIAPYRDEYKTAADAGDFYKRYEAVEYKDHPDNYYCIFNDSEGRKCLILFQATNKVIKIMKFLNRDTVVAEVTANN